MLFIIIIAVMAVSLVLSIADWIYLAVLSSKSSILEREVEKRSQEFDAFRKERTTIQNDPATGASVIESNEPLVNNPAPEVSSEDTIQIVRSVRGNFQQSTPFVPATEATEPPPRPAPPPDTSVGTLDYSTVLPFRHDERPVSAPDEQAPELPPEPEETMLMGTVPDNREYASEQPDGSQQQSQPQTWLIQLYSDTTKDADFQLMWKHVTEIIQSRPNAQIAVDLSGINFMYDKEMDYLEKINYLLAGQGGALSLINCDAELLEIFSQRPLLRSMVQQKAL